MEKVARGIHASHGMDEFLHEMDCRLAGWDKPFERLKQALAEDELALYCQPIPALEASSGYPMAEVLVRLREKEQSLLPPGEFLPLFEHNGMMPERDRWVVRHALRHLADGSRFARLAINVSGQSVQNPIFRWRSPRSCLPRTPWDRRSSS